MNRSDIIDAWARIRKIDHTIPDDVLDFMKDAAIQKLIDSEKPKNLIPRGSYNEAPEGLIEITLKEWKSGMFHYCLNQSDSKQVRNGGKVFDLRLFDVPNFENKKLGYAIMDDWFDMETGRNRPESIVRFCRYGLEEDWRKFKNRFAAQFAGDNS